VNHTASKRFWLCLEALPADVQTLARKCYSLLRQDPSHPSLQLKLLGGGRMYSVRVGLHFGALGLPRPNGVHWFWIGTHAQYDRLLRS
jgi:hypothetical protein